MQFIFATHNANIPVLGDSEKVVSCSYDEKKISVHSGTIDNHQTQRFLWTSWKAETKRLIAEKTFTVFGTLKINKNERNRITRYNQHRRNKQGSI
ncbi:MAG: hypothetical protein IPO47_01275 [Bacteroidetes bacterium]|nr:hypothetical protein [Bacteroidota bacterium]